MQQFESFAQMQRDAAMRVMEMQRRAQAAMGTPQSPPDVPVSIQPADNPLYEPVPLTAETSMTPPADDKPETEMTAGEDETPDDESERALITAILLLLMREKADERLIFALLYILL